MKTFMNMLRIAVACLFMLQSLPLRAFAEADTIPDESPSKTIPQYAEGFEKPTVSTAAAGESAVTVPKPDASNWTTTSQTVVDIVKNNATRIDVSSFIGSVTDYAKALKTAHNGSGATFDSSTADKNYLNAVLVYVNSAAYSHLTEAQQAKLVGAMTTLAKEIWAGSDTAAEKTALYAQLGTFFKTAINKGKTDYQKALALDYALYTFSVINQNSATDAAKFLKTALQVTGGMESLVTKVKSNINNEQLTTDQRARLAVVGEKLISQEKYIKQATGYSLSDKMKSELKSQVNSFVADVNGGKVTINASSRARLVDWSKNLAAVIIKDKLDTTDVNKTLVSNTITLAHKTMLLKESQGGSLYAQSVAVHGLIHMEKTSVSAKNTDRTSAIKTALLDKDFNVKDFLADAKSGMSSETNADKSAVVARASAELVTFNVANKTGKLDKATVESVIDTIKNWTGVKANLLDMRHLVVQKGLFLSVAELTTELKKDGAEVSFSSAMKSDVEAILASAKGITEKTVKDDAVEALEAALKDTTTETTADSNSEYLKATKYAESDNQKIIDLAKTITKDCKTDKEKAQAIFDYIQDNYSYKYYYRTAAGALEMLNKKEGNGADLSHLFVALCRASGLEARYKHVLAGNAKGMGDGVPNEVERIYAQVKVDGKWENADPADKRNTEVGKLAITVKDDIETYTEYAHKNTSNVSLAANTQVLSASVKGESGSTAKIGTSDGRDVLILKFSDGSRNVVDFGPNSGVKDATDKVTFIKIKDLYSAKITLKGGDTITVNIDKSADKTSTVSGWYTVKGQNYWIAEAITVKDGGEGSDVPEVATLDISGKNIVDHMVAQIPGQLQTSVHLSTVTASTSAYYGNDVISVNFGDDTKAYATINFAKGNNIRESAQKVTISQKDSVYTVIITLKDGNKITLDLKKTGTDTATISGSYTKDGSTYSIAARSLKCGVVSGKAPTIAVIDLADETKKITTSTSTNNTTTTTTTATSTIPDSLKPYLKATANCEVNNAAIKAKAAAITNGKTSDYAKAVAIFNWVRDNIDYSFYYNSSKGADGALSSKKANCCDTASLVIAMCRASGIPARYVHTGSARFSSGTYGHVWAEVYVNGKWYAADGTSSRNSFGVIKNWSGGYTKGRYAELPF